MVDFLFGQGIQIAGKAVDAGRRRDIERVLKAVFDANGGAVFFQDMAVLGSVYGFVDCIVRRGSQLSERFSQGTSELTSPLTSTITSFDSVLRAAAGVALELIEAPGRCRSWMTMITKPFATMFSIFIRSRMKWPTTAVF